MSREIHKKVLGLKLFEEILSERKTFEVRLDDWLCQPDDILVLDEIDAATKQLTGRSIRKKVGFVLKTKDMKKFFPKEDIDKYGFQIISLLEENGNNKEEQKV